MPSSIKPSGVDSNRIVEVPLFAAAHSYSVRGRWGGHRAGRNSNKEGVSGTDNKKQRQREGAGTGGILGAGAPPQLKLA